jgi:hypothetical protein
MTAMSRDQLRELSRMIRCGVGDVLGIGNANSFLGMV